MKKLFAGALVACLAMLSTPTAGASNHQITICHATGNPGHYSMPNPTKQQISSDHGHRTGQQSVHPGDIIPPFDASSHGGQEWDAFPGQNWDAEGQAIYNNGCKMPEEETTTTTIEVVPPTTTPTTVEPTTTTTTVKPTTTTTEPEATTTTVKPTTTTVTDAVVVTSTTAPVEVEGEVSRRAAPATELPRTGSDVLWLAAAGAGALALGTLAKRKASRLS